MAGRNDYKSSYKATGIAGEEKQAEHASKKGDTDWYENKYQEQFGQGLSTVEAHTAYDKEQNLALYKNDVERREVLAEYVQSFNGQDYESDKDRFKYANQVAHNTFSPLYKGLDAVEHNKEALFDHDILKALDHHKVKYEIFQKPDGTAELRFEVKDKTQHRMLEQATGSKIRLHDTKKLMENDKLMAKAMGWKEPEDTAGAEADSGEKDQLTGVITTQQDTNTVWTDAETRKMLDFHRQQFAKALHSSDNNPGLAVEFMNQSLVDGDNAQKHYSEKTLEYDKVEGKTEAEVASATEAMQDAHWKVAWSQLKEVAQDDDTKAEELDYCINVLRDIYQKGAKMAYKAGNATHYNLAISHCGETAELLAQSFEREAGLVQKDGYQWSSTESQTGFGSTADADQFNGYARDKLDSLNFGNLHHNAQTAVELMLADLEEEAKQGRRLEGKTEAGTASDDDRENLGMALEQMTRISRSVGHMMAPA